MSLCIVVSYWLSCGLYLRDSSTSEEEKPQETIQLRAMAEKCFYLMPVLAMCQVVIAEPVCIW